MVSTPPLIPSPSLHSRGQASHRYCYPPSPWTHTGNSTHNPPFPNELHTIKSERWSDPELKPLVSESEGLLDRESRMGRVSRRDPLTEGAGNLSTKSDPRGSRGRKLKGGFPRTFPSGLWSMLSTRRTKKETSWPLKFSLQPTASFFSYSHPTRDTKGKTTKSMPAKHNIMNRYISSSETWPQGPC